MKLKPGAETCDVVKLTRREKRLLQVPTRQISAWAIMATWRHAKEITDNQIISARERIQYTPPIISSPYGMTTGSGNGSALRYYEKAREALSALRGQVVSVEIAAMDELFERSPDLEAPAEKSL